MNKPPKHRTILVIETSPEAITSYRDAVSAGLRRGGDSFEVVSCPCDRLAMGEIDKIQPDVVIVGRREGGGHAAEICRYIRQQPATEGLYKAILLVTEKNPDHQLIDLLDLGADDFCPEDVTQYQLAARIRSVLRIKDMTDSLRSANQKLRSANERLAKITITDDLTGLYNMRYFKKRLEQEFTRAERYRKYLSIIMFDLDHFKQVNDNANHLLGSFVLAETGRLVGEVVRNVDIGARYGGDEFIIMLPETGPSGALTVASRVFNSISQHTFDNGEFRTTVTLSAGVSTYCPGDGSYGKGIDLVRAADQHLYEAKRSGRNQIVFQSRLPKAS